jgi:hypothetical protein
VIQPVVCQRRGIGLAGAAGLLAAGTLVGGTLSAALRRRS